MLSSSAGLPSLRRELATVVEELAVHGHGSAASPPDASDYSQEALRDRNRLVRERLENAHRACTGLQNQQVRQVVTCASARAQADQALADLNKARLPGVDPQLVAAQAEARLREAEAQCNSLREQSRQLTAPEFAPAVAVSENAVPEARNELAAAESRLEDRRRERQTAADDLARASARLDLARCAAETISIENIALRLAAAQTAAGTGVSPSDRAAASTHYDEAKQRLSTTSAAFDLQESAVPAARRKAELLESAFPSGATAELESAEGEERRVQALLLDAEAEGAQPNNDAARELREAEALPPKRSTN